MKPRTCPHCGAPVPLGRLVCEYCGTTFEEDYPALVVRQERTGVRTIAARVAIPDYAMKTDSKGLADYTLAEMRHQIAEALTGLIEIQQHQDYTTMQTVFTGRVRVLDPTFRF